MAKRWVIGGLAVGIGALVVAPEARTWLRRRLGMEPEDRRWFEEEGDGQPEHAEHEGDEPLDTREARFSLRARLSEDGQAAAPEPAAPEAAAPEAAAPEAAAPEVAAPEVAAPEVAEPEPAMAPPPPPPPPPAYTPVFAPYESVPPVAPEPEAPKTPGEDTDEVEPLPPVSTWPGPAAAPPPPPPPPPPPTELRPPPPPASRPFSGESASFRSAIDAARERVHGAAREATPNEGESTEPLDESS